MLYSSHTHSHFSSLFPCLFRNFCDFSRCPVDWYHTRISLFSSDCSKLEVTGSRQYLFWYTCNYSALVTSLIPYQELIPNTPGISKQNKSILVPVFIWLLFKFFIKVYSFCFVTKNKQSPCGFHIFFLYSCLTNSDCYW